MIGARFLLFVICSIPVTFLAAQQVQTQHQSAARDLQATTIISRALTVAGELSSSRRSGDFTGQGSITYYWAGDSVTGRVTIRGRGADQVRVDAALSGGVRSWSVSGGLGSVREPEGTKTAISRRNAANFGRQMFPAAALSLLQRDAATTVSYLGTELKNGAHVYHIRTSKAFDVDPASVKSELSTMDFFIDTATFTIASTEGKVYSTGPFAESYTHEVRYSDYRVVSGIAVPFSIAEFIHEQPISEIQLSDVVFNTGLGDADFRW